MIMAFGYTCSLVAANFALSKQAFVCLQVRFVALLKRRKGNAVFGHHVGRAYALVHLARQNNTLCCFENTLLALFPQKPRFCGSPFGTQKLSSSTDGQAQRRFGGEAEQYVLSHPRLGRIASCRISKKRNRNYKLRLRLFLQLAIRQGRASRDFSK